MATQLFGPTIPGLAIPEHDYVALAYSGSNLATVAYSQGGISGTVVAVLTLSYDGNGNVTGIAKT
jgi:hypothetical protein